MKVEEKENFKKKGSEEVSSVELGISRFILPVLVRGWFGLREGK